MTAAIIDAHHHIWRLADIPWLNGPMIPRIFGDYSAIRRDYTGAHFAADAKPEGVVASVYVQANWPPALAVEEAVWVKSEAGQGHLCQGITAFADLMAPDVGDVLDAQLAAAQISAVRQQLNWAAEPAFAYAPRDGIAAEPDFHRGMREVARRGLPFELQVFPQQGRDALALVDAFPEVTFILVHAGMLQGDAPHLVADWRRFMGELARRPNVAVKLSGLGTFIHRCTVADWRPVVTQTVDFFGPQRCMFGSNFPVERIWTSYAELVRVMRECLAGYTAQENDAIFRGTADRAYRLGLAA